MPSYHQDVIISKLNRYLSIKHRNIKLKKGYCHGFTLLWLYKMSIGQEKWFYDTIKNIAACKSKADFDEIELDIEKFLSHIEWLQNSDKYVHNIHQLDLDKVLELPRDLSLSFLFDHKQLDDTLETLIHDNKMICLSGPDHTIGVYRKDGKNYIFDPNYSRGQPRMIEDVSHLKNEIIHCLFQQKKFREKIPLEINITSDPMIIADQDHGDIESDTGTGDIDKMEIYDELLHETDDIDEPGFNGITNLYLACESGDEDEVIMLLENKADPNQVCNTDWTPLLVAADKGYTNIVRILLENGAKPNLGDNKNLTPLYLAAEAGHEDTVNLLLENGANPTIKSKRGLTPIHAALSSQQWRNAVCMLLYCNRSRNTHLNPRDMDELRKYKQQIMQAAQEIRPSLEKQDKIHLSRLLNVLYQTTRSQTLFKAHTPGTKKKPSQETSRSYWLRSNGR